jgi:hypothetical protein
VFAGARVWKVERLISGYLTSTAASVVLGQQSSARATIDLLLWNAGKSVRIRSSSVCFP